MFLFCVVGYFVTLRHGTPVLSHGRVFEPLCASLVKVCPDKGLCWCDVGRNTTVSSRAVRPQKRVERSNECAWSDSHQRQYLTHYSTPDHCMTLKALFIFYSPASVCSNLLAFAPIQFHVCFTTCGEAVGSRTRGTGALLIRRST